MDKGNPTAKTLVMRTAAEWRRWLKVNHARASEVWLTYYKGEAAKAGVSYDDSVSEALCYGWIDSLVRRIDEERYARKFTPRKPNSKWSPANKRRVDELIASGKMAAVGLSLVTQSKKTGAWDQKTTSSMQAEMPPVLKSMLAKHKTAAANFNKMSPSNKRLFLVWVGSAKRAETRVRRAREAIQLLAKNQALGLK